MTDEVGILFHQPEGFPLGKLEEPHVSKKMGNLEIRHSRLPCPEQLSWPPQLQIPFSELKTIRPLHHGLKSGRALLGEVPAVNQEADRLGLGPPDPSPNLMQLREAKAIGMLYHHRRRPRNIHSHLHHRGGHQDLNLPIAEGVHDPAFFLCPHPAVDTTDAAVTKSPFLELGGHTRRRLQIGLLTLFHEGTDHVRGSSPSDLLAHELVGLTAHRLGDKFGLHGLPSW